MCSSLLLQQGSSTLLTQNLEAGLQVSRDCGCMRLHLCEHEHVHAVIYVYQARCGVVLCKSTSAKQATAAWGLLAFVKAQHAVLASCPSDGM